MFLVPALRTLLWNNCKGRGPVCPFDRSRNVVREISESGRTNHILRDDTCFGKPFRRNRSQ